MLLLVALAATASAQTPVPVPSGQDVSLSEVLIDEAPGEPWVRFRFVAPQISREGGAVSVETAAQDIDALCRDLALPYLKLHRLDAARVVISLSDREVPFGTADPEATQFFEAFRPEGGRCIWEEF